MLAEGAYAKLYGSFSAIIGGSEAEALQDLTGGLPSRIGIGGEQAEPRFKGSGAAEEAWTLLNSLLDEGAVVCCSRQADAIRRGIIPNHAYGILRALEVKLVGGKSAKLVQVRNPWGRGLEWDGAWSDADSSWTRVAPESQRLLGRNVGTGQQVSDGTWWMTVADWQANFHRLECCRHLELLPEWTVHAVVGEWQPESTETGQWHLFPQYHLQVAAGSRMVVCLQTARGTRDHKVSLAIAPMLMEGPPTEAVGTRVLKFGERLQEPVFRRRGDHARERRRHRASPDGRERCRRQRPEHRRAKDVPYADLHARAVKADPGADRAAAELPTVRQAGQAAVGGSHLAAG